MKNPLAPVQWIRTVGHQGLVPPRVSLRLLPPGVSLRRMLRTDGYGVRTFRVYWVSTAIFYGSRLQPAQGVGVGPVLGVGIGVGVGVAASRSGPQP